MCCGLVGITIYGDSPYIMTFSTIILNWNATFYLPDNTNSYGITASRNSLIRGIK